MWEFYFCYCEGGFTERVIGDVQMLLVKPGNRRSPIATG
jgi:cyclopropane-fatty-acyl-phospholipid synthase